MYKEYRPQWGKFDSPMACYLFERFMDGDLQAERSCWDGVQSLELIGRRLLHAQPDGTITYQRFATQADAEREYEALEFPASDSDNRITEDGGKYNAVFSGSIQLKTYDTLEEAELAIARAMVEHGEFGDTWFISDRGTYRRIDDAIRKYHDEGGDKMKAEYATNS